MYPYFTIFNYTLPTYGIMMVLGLITAFVICMIRVKKTGLSTDSLYIIMSFILIGVLVGAKVLYLAVSYSPAELLAEIRNNGIAALMGGGLVYYGGLFGGLLLARPGAKFAEVPLEPYANAMIPAIPFAHAIGRIGCYLAGCCYGQPYNGILACRYMIETADGVTILSAFPIQLVESVFNLILGVVLLLCAKKKYITVSTYLVAYAMIRLILECFRGDADRGFFGIFSTSQWISILILISIAGWYLIDGIRKRKHSKYGGNV